MNKNAISQYSDEMGVVFARELMAEVFDEAASLMREQHEEMGFLGAEDFDIDAEKFKSADSLMAVFTARSEGELVGYQAFWVQPSLHYRQKTFAIQEALFVKKGHRGLTSVRFIEYCDELLRETGVDVVVRQVSLRRNYSKLLVRFGYSPLEISYARTF